MTLDEIKAKDPNLLDWTHRPLITPGEAADMLGVSRAKLDRMVKRGEVPHIVLPDYSVRIIRVAVIEGLFRDAGLLPPLLEDAQERAFRLLVDHIPAACRRREGERARRRDFSD